MGTVIIGSLVTSCVIEWIVGRVSYFLTAWINICEAKRFKYVPIIFFYLSLVICLLSIFLVLGLPLMRLAVWLEDIVLAEYMVLVAWQRSPEINEGIKFVVLEDFT